MGEPGQRGGNNGMGEGRFANEEWLDFEFLAKQRGFQYPRARKQPDGSYEFMSGLCVDDLRLLRAEIRAGGWTYTPTARTRHFFTKNGSLFDNPSLCGKHQLSFDARLEHFKPGLQRRQGDLRKCSICLRKWEALKIDQVSAPWTIGGWARLFRGRVRHFFSMPGSLLHNESLCRKFDVNIELRLENDLDDETKCKACLRKWRRLELARVSCQWGK